MASSKCTIAFLVLLLAAVAATLVHPSSAARVHPQEAGEAAPQPPASFWRPRVPLPPLPSFPCIPGLPRPRFLPPCNGSAGGEVAPLPPLPSLPPIPCIPGLPRPAFLPPCNGSGAPPPPPPQPAECRTSLSGLAPCADFLTANATGLSAPAAACCEGVKSLVKDAPICLCHVLNGDLGELLPAPARLMRAVALPRVCGAAVPFGTLGRCFRGPVPPMDAPTSHEAQTPPAEV